MLKKVLAFTGVASAFLCLETMPSGARPSVEREAPPAVWVHYELPPGVSRALTHDVHFVGRRVGSGCITSVSGALALNAPGQRMDEIAFDSNTCESIYAVGPVQGFDASRDSLSQKAGTSTQPTACTRVRCGLPGDFTLAFFLKTWYTDPAGWVVSSVRNDVKWTVHNACNVSYDPTAEHSYLWQSGWELRYFEKTSSFSCSYAVSDAKALMQNAIFPTCLAILDVAYTHFPYEHKAVGQPGGATYEFNDYKDSRLGVCDGSLSHHAVWDYETPW
jgi:hypothetical protein